MINLVVRRGLVVNGSILEVFQAFGEVLKFCRTFEALWNILECLDQRGGHIG